MPTSSLSSYLAASAKSAVTLFRQIVTLRGITLPISYHVYGPFGEHLGRPKIAHGSHNDVRRLCWPNLGCESPLAETPKSSLCWKNLCGWGRGGGGGHWGGGLWKEGNHTKKTCICICRFRCAAKVQKNYTYTQ